MCNFIYQMEEDDDDFFGQYEDSYVRVSPVEYKV